MLNSIRPELTKEPVNTFCRTNMFFALGVIRELMDTDLCVIEPTKANKFSQMMLKFPVDSDQEFLECVLDCADTLTQSETKLTALVDDNKDRCGYVLAMDNKDVLQKAIFLNLDEPKKLNPWCLAGILFVALNKNKKQDKPITIINGNIFGNKTINAVNKFNYLLLQGTTND